MRNLERPANAAREVSRKPRTLIVEPETLYARSRELPLAARMPWAAENVRAARRARRRGRTMPWDQDQDCRMLEAIVCALLRRAGGKLRLPLGEIVVGGNDYVLTIKPDQRRRALELSAVWTTCPPSTRRRWTPASPTISRHLRMCHYLPREV